MTTDDLRQIRCQEANLSVRIRGAGRPIVLLHGWPQTSQAWDPVADLLVAAGWQVIAPDLRGCGASERTVDGYEKDHQAGDIRELIEQLQLSIPLPVVGHDIGGMVAFALCRRHPELVSHLVLADLALPGFGLEEAMDVAQGGMWHFGLFLQPDVPAMIISGHEQECFAWWFADQAGDLAAIGTDAVDAYTRAYTGREALDASFGHYRTLLDDGRVNRAWAGGGSQLSLPVLAVGGELSAGERVGQGIRSVCTQVRSAVVGGAGHFVAEERPAEFHRILADFLNDPTRKAQG